MLADYHNTVDYVRAISPVSVADNTAQVSQIIDLAAYGCAEFVIATGALTDADATFAVTLSHGDSPTLADAAAPAASDLFGTLTEASFNFANDDAVFKIGYHGAKRYIRLTITPSLNASAASLAAICVLEKRKVGTL